MANLKAKANRAATATNEEQDPMTRDLARYADQYVTTKQAAEMLWVVIDHVDRLLMDGKLRPGSERIGRLIRIESKEISSYGPDYVM